MDDQSKDRTDWQRLPKKNHPQLETHNDAVKNTNWTNLGENLLLTNIPRIVLRKTERMPQGTKEKGDLLNIDQHIFKENKRTRKLLL